MSKTNKAILVVSFGTSYQETRAKNIDKIEETIGEKYPDYQIYRAFTSKMIINKIKKCEGIHINTVKEAMIQMYEEGIKEVLVQPTHMINGIENDNMILDVNQYKEQFESIKIGSPLLTTSMDYEKLVDIIMEEYKELKPEEALVLMGHGTSHYVNASYPALDYTFKVKGHANVFVGTVEGYPEIPTVLGLVESYGAKKVILAPLMIVAGDHATNDMAGDEEDSWKTIFEEAGYKVHCEVKGLGEYSKVREMFVEHLKQAEMNP